MRDTPKCLRCGFRVPTRRRATSDYCTDKCARGQHRDDEASAASERAAQEEADRVPACTCGPTGPCELTHTLSCEFGQWSRRRAESQREDADVEAFVGYDCDPAFQPELVT